MSLEEFIPMLANVVVQHDDKINSIETSLIVIATVCIVALGLSIFNFIKRR